ncbi:hypothetical protein CDL12_03473 [Handroanthus impetiginosus]|uniref:Growth-regulating factor n=1 Tax=Handroanthus impetiginosus TaxID=429701 RepID=A0A2G9I1Z4_9LAMI|nr:hypothetical protein CDL12_03473 [Handroanthus impetiginosus]
MLSQLLPLIANEGLPGNEDECGHGLLAAEKREDFSEKINLDLGIGSFALENEGALKRNKKIKEEKEEPLFTDAQFHEFYSQILVFNSITSGLAVPFHLFLPIWMSVFNSLGPAIYLKYPSFVGFSPQNRDHSSIMDPEPGRCRRTDGRKWRCSKNVVLHQKYCERHMHRGRQGSRKHVEHVQSVSRSDNKTCRDSKMPIISSVTANADNRIPTANRSVDPGQPCSNYSNSVPAIAVYRNDKSHDAFLPIQNTLNKYTLGCEVNKNKNVGCVATSTCGNSMNNGATDGCSHTEGRVPGFENANPRKISIRNGVAMRFGSSPKSVLHCGAGKVDLVSRSTNVTETEPQRCRRTDGKKWQCRRDAVPNQKYCEAHMHRGAKRLRLNAESAGDVPDTSARKAHTSFTGTRSLDNGINLNDIPASPQRTFTGDDSTSSTSDATTITDENISFCLTQSLHNC